MILQAVQTLQQPFYEGMLHALETRGFPLLICFTV